MGFSFNGLSGAAVTVSGSVGTTGLPVVSSSQTWIQLACTGTGSVATQRTVTAGKTFYLMGIYAFNLTAGWLVEVYDNDGTTARFAQQVDTNNPNPMVGTPLCSWAAGEAVKMKATNTMKFYIVGFEV